MEIIKLLFVAKLRFLVKDRSLELEKVTVLNLESSLFRDQSRNEGTLFDDHGCHYVGAILY